MLIYDGLKDVINFFLMPILNFLDDYGISDKIIKVGFGEIEWFNFELDKLLTLIIGLGVIYFTLNIVYKVIKYFVKMITLGVIK